MIISPPFLLDRNADETDADYVARCMSDTSVCVRDTNIPEGSFAVSFQLGWHGGLHLQAPLSGQTFANVRAIADGEIVYARRPTRPNETPSPAEPRNYNPYGDAPAWTDDGCVVIRHCTQIGADAQGQPVEATFFSIYEHLSALRGPALQAATGAGNGRVWRKDEIGVAGHVYGQDHQLHFEIACDDANLERLIGRRTDALNTNADGRSDVVFGELYFRLPAGTEVFSARPLDNNPVAHHRQPNQPATALTAVHTTTEALIVGLRYAGGDGAADQRGSAYLTTYREDGTPLGEPLYESDAEYDLYTRATAISTSYSAGSRPAPSAVYELLRFGRVIDTAHETLTPATVPHWRLVRYSGGEGWINLNAAGICKFSDADFPPWKGWRLVDDDIDADSRCESAMITRMIEDPNNADGNLTRAELLQRLVLPEVRNALKRMFCKFPTEFNEATVEARWGWLRNDPDFGLGDHYDEFAAHVGALTIRWNDTWLPNAHWHLQPREFIIAWRKCGWLSLNETLRILPTGNGVANIGQLRQDLSAGRNVQAQIMPSGMCHALNRIRRKYLLENPVRCSHFFGQICVETDRLRTTSEYASGMAYDLTQNAAKAAELGNTTAGDGPRFKGRGVIQLTGKANYVRFSSYRGMNYAVEPDNLQLRDDAYIACDASGFYWVAESTRDKVPNQNGNGSHWVLDGFTNINRRADIKTFQSLNDDLNLQRDTLNVTRQVNRAALHIDIRRAFFKAAFFALSDEVAPANGIVNQEPL